MASALETVVLDSEGASPLTIQSGSVYHLDALDPGLAQRRPTWTTGVEADGGLLVVDPPYDDAVMTMTVQVDPATDTKDAALAALNALTLKLQECSAAGPDGLACTYTPANATTTYTFYVKLAEYDGAPPLDPRTAEGYMTLNNQPVVKLKLTRAPFFYAPEIGTVTDAFSTNTIADYTFDAGSASNVAITSGLLDAAANFTAENRLIRNLGGYDGQGSYYDVQATVKAGLGTTLSGFVGGVLLKRVSSTQFIYVYITDNGTSSSLNIFRNNPGTSAVVATQAITPRLATTTYYWVRGRVEGNVIYAEFWTSAPTATGTPAFTTSWTMTGADITMFGQGVAGKAGMVLIPQQTAAVLDDFVIEPNVAQSSLPLMTLALPGVPGDVDAEARLIVTEKAGQSRRFIEWGVGNYQSSPLLFTSTSLTSTGFTGSSATRAGSYSTNVIRASLTALPTAMAGLLNQGHIGTYRCRMRVYVTSTDVRLRISWASGDGAYRANDYWTPPTLGWVDADLGIISVPAATLGTQTWSARVEALSPTVGDVIDLDTVTLIPAAHGYAKARGEYQFAPGSLVAHDEFKGKTAGAALNATVAPLGGTWATSGAAGDFTFADAPGSSDETIARSTASDTGNGRVATLGTATYSDVEVGVTIQVAPHTASGTNLVWMDVIARYVDANNYVHLQAAISTDPGSPGYSAGHWGTSNLLLETYVGGSLSVQVYTGAAFRILPLSPYLLRLVIYPTGRAHGALLDERGNEVDHLVLVDSAMATGGALATGKVGLRDTKNFAGAITRYYDDFYAARPAAEPIALYSGRKGEFRPDSAIREDATGTYYGNMSRYGANFSIPPAGAEARTSRVAARAKRNDIDVSLDSDVADALGAQVAITPRLLLPR